MTLEFEWDERKATANYSKHGVSFDEAKTVFSDPHSITIADADHSTDEERYVDIGLSSQGQILIVVYTERASRIRIISCRRASLRERETYEQQSF